MSEAESPERLDPSHRVSVADIRALAGPVTPHFALQVRNRIRRLIEASRRRPRPARGSARSPASRSSPTTAAIRAGSARSRRGSEGGASATDVALERARALMLPQAAARAEPATDAGYVDLLGDDVPSTGPTQDLMTSRLVPQIYERWWRLRWAASRRESPGRAWPRRCESRVC